MTLNAGDSKVTFNSEDNKVNFEGSMRLANMKEYDEVGAFLKKISEGIDGSLTLNFSDLQFLNSSGITTLSLFVLNCKKSGKPQLHVQGNKNVSWQQKSLSNFKKLWSEVLIEL